MSFKRGNLRLQQDIKADPPPEAQITSNVYNKPDRIALPVFPRRAFVTFYPALEMNQALENLLPASFFLFLLIHPPEAETIFTTALQQEQTRDIIKEITILLKSPGRDM